MRGWLNPTIIAIGLLEAFAQQVRAAPPNIAHATFDSRPWIEDLEQARGAFATLYADLEWEVFDHELDLTSVFAEAREGLQHARSEAEAQAVFNDLASRFGERHVRFNWPTRGDRSEAAPGAFSCAGLGYNIGMQAPPLALLMPGVAPLTLSPENPFLAGIIASANHHLGIVKIPLFSPRAFPGLCGAAVAALHLTGISVCDDQCRRQIDMWAAARLTEDLEKTLTAVQAAGADTVLIDIAGNGGGSEWAEAAARMVTKIRLQSTPMYFVKGTHWAKRLSDKERELRAASRIAAAQDREVLTRLADSVAERTRLAEHPCDGEPLWHGRHPDCEWLGNGFYSTGLLQAADPQALRSRSWAALVFTPLQYPYHEGIWHGPLLVLVDQATGSAAEQFAAELQDNHAAVIIGSPTVGAGCGHTDGGTPTTLHHSGAVLQLPDCVRIRPSQINLASGIQPDVLIGLRENDGPRRRAEILREKIDDALQLAGRPRESPASSP